MFQPAVAIIRFLHLKQLRLFCIIRVMALMKRSWHQTPDGT